MTSILGDHNWVWVVYHMLFCKLVISSLSDIPVKDAMQHTNKKVAGSPIDFNFSLWQKGKITFCLSWKQLYGKGTAGYYMSLPTITNMSQFKQVNRCGVYISKFSKKSTYLIVYFFMQPAAHFSIQK